MDSVISGEKDWSTTQLRGIYAQIQQAEQKKKRNRYAQTDRYIYFGF